MAYIPYYPVESPYFLTEIVSRFMTYYVHRSIQPHARDKVTQLNNERYVERPDLLAFDLYGSADLFWVIPVRNGLQDPIFDLTFGKALIIPDIAYVRSIAQ